MLVKRLTDRHWCLIAKYLRNEIESHELEEIHSLLHLNSQLGNEIAEMQHQTIIPSSEKETFDSRVALKNLRNRLKKEGLL